MIPMNFIVYYVSTIVALVAVIATTTPVVPVVVEAFVVPTTTTTSRSSFLSTTKTFQQKRRFDTFSCSRTSSTIRSSSTTDSEVVTGTNTPNKQQEETTVSSIPPPPPPLADVSSHTTTTLAQTLYAPKTTTQYESYLVEHQKSIQSNTYEQYWSDRAYEYLHWDQPFSRVLQGTFDQGDINWFSGGQLNICYNALDRHVEQQELLNKQQQQEQDNMDCTSTALIWEGDEPGQNRMISFRSLLNKVCQITNTLQRYGVKRGDVVTIYMPMVPELVMCMLACARMGAIHSVVFAGFSAEALSQRISAASSKFLITADIGKRGGKNIPIKQIVDTARSIRDTENILQHVFVWEHDLFGEKPAKDYDTNNLAFLTTPKDIHMDTVVAKQRPYCPPVSMNSEDNLFILYTSGSTGQPKGVVHTTGGYGLWAAFTARQTFQLKPGNPKDIFACVADCGWITGHTYVVYGTLLNGCTSVLFESTPLYPDPGRYWDLVDKYRVTKFYTAPTAIRSLMKYGSEVVAPYDLSSLQILGSVGEPINPEAWKWYYEVVGRERCTVVDTYWQTETGGHIITNLPGMTPMQPGSCTVPMYGIDPVLLDPITGEEVILSTDTTNNNPEDFIRTGVLAIRKPWPGMARTCLNDHERYLDVYFRNFPKASHHYYFTGDACTYDTRTGHYTITGRVDDVLNVSGHRIGTAEVESALVSHHTVAQAAVIGQPHPIKGESIIAFVTLKQLTKDNVDDDSVLLGELKKQVRGEIGAFATPDKIYITDSLPMTRSGKIMRRILRKIVNHEVDSIGDTSTLADPNVVTQLIQLVESQA